jgi:hypothetical protein
MMMRVVFPRSAPRRILRRPDNTIRGALMTSCINMILKSYRNTGGEEEDSDHQCQQRR